MSSLENHYRKQFDQPTGPVLDQIKFILRIWQSQGHTKQAISFLLMLESILETGDRQESLRVKLLRLLRPETEKTTREQSASEHEQEIDITAGPDAGTYTLLMRSSNGSTEMTAQGLLYIATWVEQHHAQLRKEVGQELFPYRVQLYTSRVIPIGSTVPELSVEAINAQEAAGQALLQHGDQRMKIVVVTGLIKEETFDDVELQPDHSITFSTFREKPIK